VFNAALVSRIVIAWFTQALPIQRPQAAIVTAIINVNYGCEEGCDTMPIDQKRDDLSTGQFSAGCRTLPGFNESI